MDQDSNSIDIARGPLDAETILVVEDDESIREALVGILVDDGYCVVGLTDGRAALDYLERRPAPGLILLDLMMPVLDGRRFRREQLRDGRIANIPVVVMTAGQSETAPLGVEILTKPMTAAAVLDVAQRYLRGACSGGRPAGDDRH